MTLLLEHFDLMPGVSLFLNFLLIYWSKEFIFFLTDAFVVLS